VVRIPCTELSRAGNNRKSEKPKTSDRLWRKGKGTAVCAVTNGAPDVGVQRGDISRKKEKQQIERWREQVEKKGSTTLEKDPGDIVSEFSGGNT